MEFTFTVKAQKIGHRSLNIPIPKQVREVFGIEGGDFVDLIVKDDGIHIPLTTFKMEHRE